MDEIDEILEGISQEIPEEEKTEIVTKEKSEVDATDTPEIEQALINQTIDDRKTADKIFNLFFADLGFGKDRSQASKEAINKSLELKIQASRNLIELLKLKKEAGKNAMGIFVNTMSKKKVGIDIDNIMEDIED